jgi:MFS family permease
MSFAEAAPSPAAREDSATQHDPAPRLRLRFRRFSPRRDLRASVGDGTLVSAMVGIGETYFAAFALALGSGETLAGLIATVPMLAGASLQLAMPRLLAGAKSYKRWIVLLASLQAAALLILPLAGLLSGRAAAWWVFVAASCYWAAGQATAPAWNTWIEEIVPRRLRANFFAYRGRMNQFGTLAGFVLGAIALELGKASGWLRAAFAAIFLVGSSCRFGSAWFLSRQSEPSRGRYQLRQVPLREALLRSRSDGGAPLVLYLFAMQAAVQISGPYFSSYMLAQRELSYVSFMVLLGLGFLGKILALPLWGRVAHAAGPRRLMRIGGVAIVPVAALWLGADWFASLATTLPLRIGSLELQVHLSAEMVYLCCVQLISGSAWAAYELAMLLLFIETIPRQDRPCVLTYYNFGNAAAQLAGGLIGAAILQIGGESHAAYMAVFAGSSLMRLATVPLLRSVTRPAAGEVVRGSEVATPARRAA